MFDHGRKVLANERRPLGKSNFGEVLALEDPRIADRRASDHHRVATGLGLNPIDIGDNTDIAVADDGNLHRGFDLGDGRPIGFAFVGLRLRAAMHGNGAGTVIFQDVCHFQIVARLIIPA
jgi:hypothetical protein